MLLALYFAGTLLPALAVTIRLLHDTDRNGWWILAGASLAPIGCVLGAVGCYLFALGLGLAIFGVLYGPLFDLGETVTSPFGDSVSALFQLGSSFADLAEEMVGVMLLLGLALLGVDVIAGIAGGVLAIMLLVYPSQSGTPGDNKFGTHTESDRGQAMDKDSRWDQRFATH